METKLGNFDCQEQAIGHLVPIWYLRPGTLRLFLPATRRELVSDFEDFGGYAGELGETYFLRLQSQRTYPTEFRRRSKILAISIHRKARFNFRAVKGRIGLLG